MFKKVIWVIFCTCMLIKFSLETGPVRGCIGYLFPGNKLPPITDLLQYKWPVFKEFESGLAAISWTFSEAASQYCSCSRVRGRGGHWGASPLICVGLAFIFSLSGWISPEDHLIWKFLSLSMNVSRVWVREGGGEGMAGKRWCYRQDGATDFPFSLFLDMSSLWI